ncbi:hypothetical protein CLU79DRAFT_704808 [Phycomyces nitens]|nr:hypothetical protein CLU79DRAFT_704808 [Phycomyces nitens]
MPDTNCIKNFPPLTSGTLSSISSSTSDPSSSQTTNTLRDSLVYSVLGSQDSTKSLPNLEKYPENQLFVIKFSQAFVANGAPSHRLDHCAQQLAQKFGIKAQFGYFPGFLIISFGEPGTLTYSVQLIKVNSSLNLNRLISIFQLFESVMCDEISVLDATRSLEPIVCRPSIYPTWLIIAAHAVASSISTPMFFGGGPIDMLFGLSLGFIVVIGSIYVSHRVTRLATIFDILLSGVVGFLATVISTRLPSRDVCFYALSIGGVVNLLPGYATLVSILEIADGAIASGTLRLTTTLIYSLLLGFGLAIGANTHQLIFPSLALESSSAACKSTMSPLYHIILVPLFAATSVIKLKGNPQDYPVMLVLAVISHAVHTITLQNFAAYPHMATILAAFAVASASNIYARLRPTVGFADMLTGLMFLVPGSIGVASSLDTFGEAISSSSPMSEISVILNAGQQGIAFAAHMLIIAASVSVGLVLAAVVMYPLRKLIDFRRGSSHEYKRKNWVGEVTL